MAKLVADILTVNKFADIDITINNEFNEESNILNIDINVKSIVDIASKLKPDCISYRKRNNRIPDGSSKSR